MNYVNSLNLFGVEAKEIPSIKGAGAPTGKTEGAVGCLYMDTDTGDLYKCTSTSDGSFTWVDVTSESKNELFNVRIGHDGREYPSAGEAVRGQINELRNGYSVFTGDDFVQGYMNANGLQSASIRIRLKNAVKVKKGDVLTFTNTLRSCIWVLADNNINQPTVINNTSESDYGSANKTYEIPADGYIMINLQNAWNWGGSTAITPADFTGEIKLYSADRISELSDRVDGFTDAIHRLDCAVDGYTSADFESGSFEVGTGKYNSSIRIRLKNAVKVKKGDVLSFENPNGYYFIVSLLTDGNLNAATTVIVDSGWKKLTTFEAIEDGYFYVLVANSYSYSESTAIVPTDFTGAIHHHRYDPRIEELKEKHAIPYPVDTDKTKAFAALFNGKVNVEPFLFFTDPHLVQSIYPDATAKLDWEKEFEQYMDCLRRYYNETPVDNIICGGDWYDGDTQDVACWKMGRVYAQMRSITDNFHLVVGNHDTNEQGKLNADSATWTGTLNDKTISNLWYRSHGKPYYTFETANTRFFVLNTGKESGGDYLEQYEWFVNELLQNTAENIVLFFHIVRGAGNGYVQDFANTITLYAKYFNERSTDVLNYPSLTFGNARGKVRFVMAGHRHADSTEVLNTIPVVETTWMGDGGVPTFDLCLADYDNNTLHMVRIGTGEDRTVAI